MSKSNGFGRKIIKIIRLPFIILFYRTRGLKITLSSSFPLFSSTFENCKYITIGKHCNFDKNTIIRCFKNKSDVPNVVIGSNCCFGNSLKILSGALVKIEDNVTIAGDVLITSENHGLDPTNNSFNDNELIVKPVLIGRGSWIGEKCIILPGVEIGEKAVIGAGSVVTKNVPAYSIAVGNPAKVIKIWDDELKVYIRK